MAAPYGDPTDPNPIGSSDDIQNRVIHVLPRRWWQFLAPIRGWVIGGISDAAAQCYTWIIYAKTQSRVATSTGMWLDLIAYDFLGRHLLRVKGVSDDLFRTQIVSTILQERVTRKGLLQILTNLLHIAPRIIEPWNPGDCGGWSGKNQIVGYGGYGRVSVWGSLKLPGQIFVRLSRSGLGPSGIPLVAGYGGYSGGYYGPNYPFNGAIEWVGSSLSEIGVTDEVIEDAIVHEKPSGTIVWLNIS